MKGGAAAGPRFKPQRLLKGAKGAIFDVKSKLDRGQKLEGIDLWRR
jgi:hypothetical protein